MEEVASEFLLFGELVGREVGRRQSRDGVAVCPDDSHQNKFN